jgi:hypothetical protein
MDDEGQIRGTGTNANRKDGPSGPAMDGLGNEPALLLGLESSIRRHDKISASASSKYSTYDTSLNLDIPYGSTYLPARPKTKRHVKTERERKLLDIPSLGATSCFPISFHFSSIDDGYFCGPVLISSHNVGERACVRAKRMRDAGMDEMGLI